MIITSQACKSKSGVSKKEISEINKEMQQHENAKTLTFYDWNAGYLKAKRLDKILLVDVYTEWCGWCKVMDSKTYTDSTVIATLNKNFVCVKFNPEIRKDSFIFETTTVNNTDLHTFLFDRRSSGYPTTSFWLNPKVKQTLEVVPGYMDPSRFMTLLNELIAKKAANP